MWCDVQIKRRVVYLSMRLLNWSWDSKYCFNTSRWWNIFFTDSLPPNAALSSSITDLSTVNISWSPPFALPGTFVAKYNISVTSNGTTTNYLTSDSYFVLQLSNITDSPCDEINVTVSRNNTVSGMISMPVITFYPPSGTVYRNCAHSFIQF